MAFALTTFSAACGGDDGNLPTIDCNAVTPPSFANVAVLDTCTACHSSALSGGARFGAPAGINYDTYAAAVASADDGVSEVYGGTMPPGGSVPEADKQDFYAWALCGTPQ